MYIWKKIGSIERKSMKKTQKYKTFVVNEEKLERKEVPELLKRLKL